MEDVFEKQKKKADEMYTEGNPVWEYSEGKGRINYKKRCEEGKVEGDEFDDKIVMEMTLKQVCRRMDGHMKKDEGPRGEKKLLCKLPFDSKILLDVGKSVRAKIMSGEVGRTERRVELEMEDINKVRGARKWIEFKKDDNKMHISKRPDGVIIKGDV